MSNISYLAIKTITFQKIKEFFSEFQYTIISPLFSLFIFTIVLGTLNDFFILNSSNSSYLEFVAPGLIIMIVMQTSYQNISESLIFMKQIGSFNDYLISPISRIEIFLSLIFSSIFIGIFIGLINIFFLNLFIHFSFFDYFLIFYYLLITSIIFSTIGSLVGFISYSWDFQQSIYNFCIIPISFLSGTFFSLKSIDEKWYIFYQINPFYYLVKNFRGSFLDKNIHSINENIYLFIFTLIFFLFAMLVYNKGYKVIF